MTHLHWHFLDDWILLKFLLVELKFGELQGGEATVDGILASVCCLELPFPVGHLGRAQRIASSCQRRGTAEARL